MPTPGPHAHWLPKRSMLRELHAFQRHNELKPSVYAVMIGIMRANEHRWAWERPDASCSSCSRNIAQENTTCIGHMAMHVRKVHYSCSMQYEGSCS